ncbi:MAG: SDR family NAD(P)-dependent oxidoreductase [Candidatus Dojkabacteria bacterium]
MNIRSKTILITGAAQGIGYALARTLANQEKTILLADLNDGKLKQVAAELEPKCKQVVSYAGDLTNEKVRIDMVSDILASFSSLDVLINNAGVTHDPKPLQDLSDEEFDFNFNVNTKLPFQLMRAFLPAMQENNNGMIINISSAANIMGYEDLSVYSATKSALSSLTDSLAAENKTKNIKAIAIMPSRTNTPMQVKVRGEEVAESSQPPEFVAEIISKVISGEIPTKTGDDIRIRENKFVVEEDVFSKDF